MIEFAHLFISSSRYDLSKNKIGLTNDAVSKGKFLMAEE